MESKELVDLTLAQQKQFDLVSFRVSWSQAVLFGCYEVRFLINILCGSSSLGYSHNIHNNIRCLTIMLYASLVLGHLESINTLSEQH